MSAASIFSFFSGAGFLDLGFEKAGFDIAFVNEIHEPFVQAYQHSRKALGLPEPQCGYFIDGIDLFLRPENQELLRDLVNEKRKDGPIGFVGGPPCPDFSVAGKNKGSEGDNGRLSQSYVDLICQVRPDFFLFENVKGLWRTNKHRQFYDQLKLQLRNAGYYLDDRLINAIEYGVAQDRDRIILIGVHESKLAPDFAFNLSRHLSLKWNDFIKYPARTAFDDYAWVNMDGTELTPSKYGHVVRLPAPSELTVDYWFKKNQVDQHPNCGDVFTPRAGLAKFKSVLEGDVSKKSYKRLHRYRYSPTAAYGNNEVHIHPTQPRRISVAEALAIQSLPKEFCLPPTMTLTNKFKTIGNGVPFLVANGLAKMIATFLKENTHGVERSESRQSYQETAQGSVVRLHQRAFWDESALRERRAA